MLNEDYSGSIATAVRIRPFSQKEIETDGNNKAIDCSNPNKVLCLKTGSPVLSFSVDHVFNDTAPVNLNKSQKELYETLAVPLLEKAFLGYNACLFAYGVTSSGKTYSMYGTPSNPGIVPRIVEDVFDYIRIRKGTKASISVKFSYCEIYNEKIFDLLQDKNPPPKLRVREDPFKGPYVQDLVQPAVHSPEEVFDWLRKGDTRRRVAATEWNARSSRSHTIASFHLTKRELASFSKKATVESVITSKLNLVDLAGSERLASNSKVGGRIAETGQINKSLFTLRRVIYQLSGDQPLGSGTPAATPLSSKRKQNSYVSYRDSLLTWILKDSLGGNSVTTMLATVSPSSLRIEDTISTLQHVIRAQRIVNQAKVNEDPSGVIIRELKAQVERLQRCYKEASVPDSPLSGQIKTLENLLRAREKEVANLTKELTDRTLDCERLRAEVRLRSESCDVRSQPLFGDGMDPEALSETPIKRARSYDERDSGAYSDLSRPLPDGSDKSDSAIQTDSADKADASEADSFSNTVLSEATMVVDIEGLEDKEVRAHTDDELFKLVPLAEYDRILSDLRKFEAYRGVKKVNTSVDVNEAHFGLCVLPTEQLSALKDKIGDSADTNPSIGQIASLESGERLKFLNDVEKCDAATSSLDLDCEILPKTALEVIFGKDKELWDQIAAIEAKKYTESVIRTNEESAILRSELVAMEEEMQSLKFKLKAFTNVGKREVATCSADLDCKVIDKAILAQITNEANDMRDRLRALDAKTYVDSMTLTSDTVEVISKSELATLRERIQHLDSLVGAYTSVKKCEAFTSSADLDYEVLPKSMYEQIIDERIKMRHRLGVIDAKKFRDSATVTEERLGIIPASELSEMREQIQFLSFKLRALTDIEKRESSTSTCDLHLAIIPNPEFEMISSKLKEANAQLGVINAKKFVDVSSLTEGEVEILPRTEFEAMKKRLVFLESQLRTIGKVVRLELSGGGRGFLTTFEFDQINSCLNGMRERLAKFEGRVFADASTETNDYELGVTLISTNFFNELYQRQRRLREKLTSLKSKSKSDASVFTEFIGEQLVHRCEEPTEQSPSQSPILNDNGTASDTLPEVKKIHVGTKSRRIDKYILERVEFYENLHARVNTTQAFNVSASSKGLKRPRLEPI